MYDPDLEIGSKTERALTAVGSERKRQERLKETGKFKFTCAGIEMTPAEKFAVLGEEFGEVAREVLTQPDDAIAHDTKGSREGLRSELIQVAAVAVAWVESL
jgi:hypothetical protein